MNCRLLKGDCIEVMNNLIKEGIKVDAIMCDLPYGVTSLEWDNIIPFEPMWDCIEKIKKDKCPILFFASQPFTTELISSNKKNYAYELIWKKNVPTGIAQAKYRPMKYHETIQCFYMTGTTYNPIMKERVGKHKECYRYNHYCGITYVRRKERCQNI